MPSFIASYLEEVRSADLKDSLPIFKVLHILNKMDLFEALLEACGRDDLGRVRVLLEHGVKVNKVNYDGDTPLFIASSRGNVEIARVLIEYGANVNHKQSPLFWACINNRIKIVQLLIQHGATVNHPNPPLFSACHRGYNDIVQVLCEHGADVNYMNEPLSIAERTGNIGTAKILLAYGAHVCTIRRNSEIKSMLDEAEIKVRIVHAVVSKIKSGHLSMLTVDVIRRLFTFI